MTLLADIPTIPDAAATSAAVAAIFVMLVFIGVGVVIAKHFAAAWKESNQTLAGGVERQGETFKVALHTAVGEMRAGMAELKGGLEKINESIEQRSMQDQNLFDKQLEVVVKVTESLGSMGSRIADNTREIGELKVAVRDIQQRVRT